MCSVVICVGILKSLRSLWVEQRRLLLRKLVAKEVPGMPGPPLAHALNQEEHLFHRSAQTMDAPELGELVQLNVLQILAELFS